jgi:quinol monooxygenase YgiN
MTVSPLKMTLKCIFPLFVFTNLTFFSFAQKTDSTKYQSQTPVVRIAKLHIDSVQLDSYKVALKEQIEAAVRTEAGVLTLNAVSDKNNPTHITVFEIYADQKAYQAHLLTPHFLKYKTTTKTMVKSLELVETVPIALKSK